MFKRIYYPTRVQIRKCTASLQQKIKPEILLDERTNELIKQETIKPRHHPGIVHKTTIPLPQWLTKSMKIALEDYPIKTIFKDALNLYRYLIARQAPSEKEIVDMKYAQIRQTIEMNTDIDNMLDDERVNEKIHNDTMRKLKPRIYAWAAIQYDKYRSLMYMLARGAQDYAICYRILDEIRSRDVEFHPKTLLDFGSGIGTVSWVASELWGNSLKERVCVDISTEIDELAMKLENLADPKFKSGHFHRQYLPIASVPTYDIVVSAFSLLELPGRKMRLDTLATLWRKTEKYLVIVEQGSKGGFQIINEARDFILHLTEIHQKTKPYNAFVFAPCPHELPCPQKNKDDYVCNFEASYFKLSFGKKLDPKIERFSYVIFKKGSKTEKDHWPRIIRPVLVRSCHTICRMCTAGGKLQEIIFSKSKHERPVYYCARGSRWGDRLPIKIINKEEISKKE